MCACVCVALSSGHTYLTNTHHVLERGDTDYVYMQSPDN